MHKPMHIVENVIPSIAFLAIAVPHFIGIAK
jgi:hypothetical protein